MRNPFRRRLCNEVTIRSSDGTVREAIYLNPPSRFGPNTCDIYLPEGVDWPGRKL